MRPICRRRLLRAAACAAIGAAAAPVAAAAAGTVVETRDVAGFDSVSFDGVGELSIEQGPRERLTIEAEPHVLAKIVTAVRQRRLSIGYAPGRIDIRLPVRFRLELMTLRRLESHASGDIRVGALRSDDALALLLAGSGDVRLERVDAPLLEVRMAGSGDVDVSGGRVDTQRVTIEGSGNYTAWPLASRHAELSIDGSGDIGVSVAERLQARIGGSGDIRYRGEPRVTHTVSGSGSVERDAGERAARGGRS